MGQREDSNQSNSRRETEAAFAQARGNASDGLAPSHSPTSYSNAKSRLTPDAPLDLARALVVSSATSVDFDMRLR